jgi:predicted DNA-binding WGR domain protein
MERAFGRKDCKSRKFWWIDYDGCDFMVNDGKCGSVGKFMHRNSPRMMSAQKIPRV